MKNKIIKKRTTFPILEQIKTGQIYHIKRFDGFIERIEYYLVKIGLIRYRWNKSNGQSKAKNSS